MLIEVGDPVRNLVLNVCFYAIGLITLLALVPWKALGAARLSHSLRWLMVPALGLAVVYETAMPVRFDIRIDLLLLLPAYGLLILTSIMRWRSWRQST